MICVKIIYQRLNFKLTNNNKKNKKTDKPENELESTSLKSIEDKTVHCIKDLVFH